MKGKSKSSHDLLKDDPRLSAVPAVNKYVIDASTCPGPFLLLAILSYPTFLFFKEKEEKDGRR